MVQAQGWCGQKLLTGWAQFEMFKCEICYKDGKDNILKKILEKEFFFFSKQTWRYGTHFLWYYINKKDIFKL